MTEYIDLLIGDLERIIKANGSVMGGTKFPADKVNDIIKKYQNKEISEEVCLSQLNKAIDSYVPPLAL